MKTTFTQTLIISSCLFFLVFNSNAQTEKPEAPQKSFIKKVEKSKILFDYGFGIRLHSHMGFEEAYESWNSPFDGSLEFGVGGMFVHKSGLVFKGDFFANSKNIVRQAVVQNGAWERALGGSFGIGCVVSHNPEKNKSLSVLSLSLGNRHSGLTMDGEFQTFGDIDINGERQTFTIHNYFIDLNLKSVGIFSRKKFSEKTLFFIQSVQLGILTGLNKSHWKIEETQERIQGVNKTFPLSFYIKISLGLGAN